MKPLMNFISISTLFLLSQTLQARENPFVPVETYGGEPLVKPIPAPDFTPVKPIQKKETVIPLPVLNQAKCEAKPPVKEQNRTKVWKTQKVQEPQIVSSKPAKKPILFVEKKKKHPKNVHRQKHKKVVKKRVHHAKYRLVYKNDNLKLYTKGRTLKIITDDKIIADFMLKSPARLVLDFGDDFVLYDTIHKFIKTPYIKEIKIGTHNCFYRLTLVLKKRYRYRLKPIRNGYIISFL